MVLWLMAATSTCKSLASAVWHSRHDISTANISSSKATGCAKPRISSDAIDKYCLSCFVSLLGRGLALRFRCCFLHIHHQRKQVVMVNLMEGLSEEMLFPSRPQQHASTPPPPPLSHTAAFFFLSARAAIMLAYSLSPALVIGRLQMGSLQQCARAGTQSRKCSTVVAERCGKRGNRNTHNAQQIDSHISLISCITNR